MTRRPAMSDNVRGAALMMASMAAFTLNDTAIKSVEGQVPLAQAIFLRGVLSTFLIYLAARRMGAIRVDLPRREWVLIGVRSLADLGATFLFLTALFHMPIANVTAIMQALPLTVALAAALAFAEPLGWRRLAAITIGLGGVLLIVRPGAEGFSIYSVYALGAVGFVTVRDLAARRLSPRTPSITAALAGAVIIMLGSGAVSLVEGWAPLTAKSGGLLVLAGLFILVGYLTSIMTMRVGEIGFVAPFRYTGLVWALVLGLAVFGDWPTPLTLIGAAVVVATGIFTIYRERVRARKARKAVA